MPNLADVEELVAEGYTQQRQGAMLEAVTAFEHARTLSALIPSHAAHSCKTELTLKIALCRLALGEAALCIQECDRVLAAETEGSTAMEALCSRARARQLIASSGRGHLHLLQLERGMEDAQAAVSLEAGHKAASRLLVELTALRKKWNLPEMKQGQAATADAEEEQDDDEENEAPPLAQPFNTAPEEHSASPPEKEDGALRMPSIESFFSDERVAVELRLSPEKGRHVVAKRLIPRHQIR
jgi:hypothetical protein